MPRKRTGYDAACYYDGKLLGRCTKADSDAYTLLMNACGGDAARVLREYAYFSPELRAILEKAALMQADRNRTGGMFHAPKSSPWGEVQSCETLCPGVFLVSTASHGGTMVANEVAAVLSPAAKKCGFKDKGYICYEEDAQESVVLRELLDKKLWNIPDRIKDKGQFEENLNQSIRQYNPKSCQDVRAWHLFHGLKLGQERVYDKLFLDVARRRGRAQQRGTENTHADDPDRFHATSSPRHYLVAAAALTARRASCC